MTNIRRILEDPVGNGRADSVGGPCAGIQADASPTPQQAVARVILGEPRLTGIAPFDPNAPGSAGGLFGTGLRAGPSSSLPGRQVYLMSWTPIASPLLIAPVPTGPDVTYRTNQPTRQLELPLPPTMFTREVPYVGEVARAQAELPGLFE